MRLTYKKTVGILLSLSIAFSGLLHPVAGNAFSVQDTSLSPAISTPSDAQDERALREEREAVLEQEIQENTNELLDGSGPYDIMIRVRDREEDAQAASEDEAEAAQAQLLDFLESERIAGRVESYESFYIVNSIHAIILSADTLQMLSEHPDVEYLSENEKIEYIAPVEEGESVFFHARTAEPLYVPDERNIEWGVSYIHADKVWEEYGYEGQGVVVGIIDSGVNYKLPELKSSFMGYDAASDSFIPGYYKDFVDGLSEPSSSYVNDHGTHVAGIIAGRGGANLNQIGAAPKIKYISARAVSPSGSRVSTILEASQWMLEKRPDIINNSWGKRNNTDYWFVEIARAWRDAGIVAVFSSGNRAVGEQPPVEGSILNPASLLNVIAVGSIDQKKKISEFSKKGPSAFDPSGAYIKPELVAPGQQIRSLSANGRYINKNGTSMAAPFVTAAIALIKNAKPDITIEEIESLLKQTAQPLSDAQYPNSPNMAYGYGMVDAYAAVSVLKGKSIAKVAGTIYAAGAEDFRVEIVETGGFVFADADGRYYLDAPIRPENPRYTLRVSARGFDIQTQVVDFSSGLEKTVDFTLLPTDRAAFSGRVVDELNQPIEGANVKFVLDGMETTASSAADGGISGSLIKGNYRVFVFKDGYRPKNMRIQIADGNNALGDLHIHKLKNLQNNALDYGYAPTVVGSNYKTISFRTEMRGMAVGFSQSNAEAVLRNIEIFAVNNNTYRGRNIEIGVLGYDTQGRLIELVPFKNYTDLIPNAWNTIAVGEYGIKGYDRIYVTTRFPLGTAESFGVLYDTHAGQEAINNSYIYDGSFIRLTGLSEMGGFGIKTHWYLAELRTPETQTPPAAVPIPTERESMAPSATIDSEIREDLQTEERNSTASSSIGQAPTIPSQTGSTQSSTGQSSGGSFGGGGSRSGGGSGRGSSAGSRRTVSQRQEKTTQSAISEKQIDGKTVPQRIEKGRWLYNPSNGDWTMQDASGRNYTDAWAEVFVSVPDHAGRHYGWFRFDHAGKMLTGWYTDAKNDVYYLETASGSTQGVMVAGWKQIQGKWYYFMSSENGNQPFGSMLKNTKTPDGYTVGADGAWLP